MEYIIKALFNGGEQFSPFMPPDSLLTLPIYLSIYLEIYVIPTFRVVLWRINYSSVDGKCGKLNFPVQFMNMEFKLGPSNSVS